MSDTTLQNEFSLKLTNATRCFFLSNHRVSIMRKSNARALGIDARRGARVVKGRRSVQKMVDSRGRYRSKYACVR